VMGWILSNESASLLEGADTAVQCGVRAGTAYTGERRLNVCAQAPKTPPHQGALRGCRLTTVPVCIRLWNDDDVI
jgi:hypothetical protein